MSKVRSLFIAFYKPGTKLNTCVMWYLGLNGSACLLLGIYNGLFNSEEPKLAYYSIGGALMALLVITKNYGITTRVRRSICGGSALEWLLPPDEADHRIIELDEAMDRWVSKYGQKKAEILYVWQSLISVALFWFDRVVVKVLARK